MRRKAIDLLSVILLLASALCGAPAKDLQIYFVDVEGGKSALFVSPCGESLLVDTGFDGFDGRDADRIVAAAKVAGVRAIDYLLMTHYHGDHAGGIMQLASRMPIHRFFDRGPSQQTEEPFVFENYKAIADKGSRTQLKPGDVIPIPGLDVRVLSAGGEVLSAPLAGAGQPNPECADFVPKDVAANENVRSIGIVVTYGEFRMLNLADLPWGWEKDLVCPVNKIGEVDVFLLPHHGNNAASPPQLMHAIQPRVATSNTGPRKGGGAESFRVVNASPDLEGYWALHYSIDDGTANPPEPSIANPDEKCEGKWIKLTAQPDGAFTVTNSRNGNQEPYAAKP